MSAEGTGARRLAHVDGLRGLAALYVVVTHVVLIAAPAHLEGRSEGARPSWLPPGHLAVAVFIVLSGFCLTVPVVRDGGRLAGGARGFYRRRARRILPVYYAALGVTLVLVWTVVGEKTGTFWDFSVPVSLAGYLGNAFLVQDVIGFWQVSVPFWSIAVEVQIYLLFPLLVLACRRFGIRLTVFYAVYLSYLASIGASLLGHAGPAFFPGLTVHFVGLFTIGMAAAWLAAGGSARPVPWNALALGFATTTLLAGVAARGTLDAVAPFLELPLALTVACLLVAAAQPTRTRGVQAVLGSRALAFVGTFSYSLYLIHAPLLQAFWQYALRPHHLGAALDAAILGLVGVPLVLAAAYGFFLVFERPFIRRRSVGSGEDADGAIAGAASPVNALAPVANAG